MYCCRTAFDDCDFSRTLQTFKGKKSAAQKGIFHSWRMTRSFTWLVMDSVAFLFVSISCLLAIRFDSRLWFAQEEGRCTDCKIQKDAPWDSWCILWVFPKNPLDETWGCGKDEGSQLLPRRGQVGLERCQVPIPCSRSYVLVVKLVITLQRLPFWCLSTSTMSLAWSSPFSRRSIETLNMVLSFFLFLVD